MSADPDGARQLLAQAQAAQRKRRPESVVLHGQGPFDPMRLYARMARYYRFSHQEMEQMHFVTFFGYLREAQIMNDEEKAENDRIRHQGSVQQHAPGADGMGVDGFPVATPYEGETVEI